jgi:uncharacterized repeat protein (TIGR01451 family)
MSEQFKLHRFGRSTILAARFWLGVAASIVTTGPIRAQEPAPPPVISSPATTADEAPAGAATVPPGLDPDVQVVRFSGPPGLNLEVVAPGPLPIPVPADISPGLATVGLKMGTGYRLRLTNIPHRPNAELYPVVEIVGHLHRPEKIEPVKYPIRVVLEAEDLYDVVDRGRLITKVVYLEDQEQALPLRLPKDQIPVVTINPTEDPLKVAAALGRVVAIVRIGGRRPVPEEMDPNIFDAPLWTFPQGPSAVGCPFSKPDGVRCGLPCGPVRGTPPPPGRVWMPRDEYLCDGGDRGTMASPAGTGGLSGIEPRDAIIRFDVGVGPRSKAKVLPTNVVCVYAPRFAEVRISTGLNEAYDAQGTVIRDSVAQPSQTAMTHGPKRLAQNQAPQLARLKDRASGMKGRTYAGEHSDLKSLRDFDAATHLAMKNVNQGAETARSRQRVGQNEKILRLDGIKTAEGLLVTVHGEGASQAVMSWRPNEMAGVETPPDRPGLAVVKRVNAEEALPGETLTFTISYRNMGNTPIRAVSIVDSLLPRLEYVKGTSRGPKGTTFVAAENRVGSSELRWELPGSIAPGASGHVSFQAVVR